MKAREVGSGIKVQSLESSTIASKLIKGGDRFDGVTALKTPRKNEIVDISYPALTLFGGKATIEVRVWKFGRTNSDYNTYSISRLEKLLDVKFEAANKKDVVELAVNFYNLIKKVPFYLIGKG